MTHAAEPPALPRRDPRGHKGTFGTVAVVGGCARRSSDADPASPVMLGGPCFAAIAALRAGCGLVRLVLPEPLLVAGLSIAPGATGIALPVDHEGDLVPHQAAEIIDALVDEARCVAVGPGLGVSPGSTAAVLRAAGQDAAPIVLDADALNALAHVPDLQRDFRAAAVITPHVAEFERLAASLGVTIGPRDDHPARATGAEQLAQRLGCVVVLKSSSTIVTDGHQTWAHDEPNPVLATAGTGDVLCGIIASLIAQHGIAAAAPALMRDPNKRSLFDCARLGVRAHALAARAWSRREQSSGGMLAQDLLAEVAHAVESLRA